jgi:O-antigen/teichoic acid export membrane protein
VQEKTQASPLKAFLHGALILTVSNIVLKAINFFLLPLYTAYLTPEQLGINDTIVNSTSLIFTVLVLAFDSAYSAFYYDADTQEHRDKVFNTIWFSFLCSSVVALILVLFAEGISLVLFNTPDYALAMRFALIGVILNLWYLPFALDCRIQNKMGIFAIVSVSGSVVMILLNILFVVFLGLGFYALICSLLLSNLLQVILYVFLCKKSISPRFFDKVLLRSMLKYSVPLLPSVLAYWVVSLSSTYIILMYFSTAEVGIYGIASRCVGVVNMVTSAFYMSYTAYAFQSAREEGAPEKFRAVLNVFFLMISALVFSGSIFGKEIIVLMADPSYLASYTLLPGLMFGQLAYGVATVVGYGISICKKSIFNTIAVLCSAVVSIGLNFALIPSLGAYGASLTACVSYCVMAVLLYIFSERLYPCGYQIVRIGICFAILFLASLLMLDSSFWVKLGVWVAGLALLAVVFRESLKEAAYAIRRMLPRAG